MAQLIWLKGIRWSERGQTELVLMSNFFDKILEGTAYQVDKIICA